ncbi:MAG: LarC family nickel insertion protein [Bacteroidales bacterium]|nr:LarC family nickel insertion protein [Bacteroidales bacterium]
MIKLKEKILYFDCFSGISGDMTIAALVELGVPAEYLITELEKLDLSGFHLNFEQDERKGINGLRVDVVLEDSTDNNHGRTLFDIKKMISKHNNNTKKVQEIIKFVQNTGGIEYAEKKMKEYQSLALTILNEFPDNEARKSLHELVRFVIERKK